MPLPGDRSPSERELPNFALGRTIARAAIPALCERLRALLSNNDGNDGLVVCDVAALRQVDAVALEALARLQLTARRCGYRLWLRRVSPELRALLTLTGLAEVLPVEPRGQVEQRKQPRRIEEEGDAGQPVA